MRLATLLICLATMATAQSPQWGQWAAGPTEFTEHQAWVLERDDGNLTELTVLCAADTAYVSTIWHQGEAEQMTGTLTLAVDDQTFDLPGRYLFYAAYPGWAAVAPSDLIDALRAGNAVTASTPTRGPTSFRLNGSGDAIAETLQGCGMGSGYNASASTYFSLLAPDETGTLRPVEEPAPAEQTPITRAALTARAADACQSAPVLSDTAILTADLDGDDRPDILLDWSQVSCPNANGAAPSIGAGFCGAANCAIDIYLSSTFQPGAWPDAIFSHMEVPPRIEETDDLPVIRTQTAGGTCPFAELCDQTWQWNGTELVTLEN